MIFLFCFSSQDMGQLIEIRGIMKSEGYIKMKTFNYQSKVLNPGRRFTFQQDNDPKHTSKSVVRGFRKTR